MSKTTEGIAVKYSRESRPIEVASYLQDTVRDILVWITGRIPNESVAGAVFATALIVTDHLFNIVKG